MKYTAKKLIAFLMVLIMMFDAAPFAAFAENDGADNSLIVQPTQQADESTPAQKGEVILPAGESAGVKLFDSKEDADKKDEETDTTLDSSELKVEQLTGDALDGLIVAYFTETAQPALRGLRNVKKAGAGESQTRYLAYNIEPAVKINEDETYHVEVKLENPVELAADGTVSSLALFHIVEKGAVQVSNVQFSVQDGFLYGFSFDTDSFSPFVIRYTVDFVYKSAEGKICINFENKKENSNELLHISYYDLQKATILSIAGILADAPALTENVSDWDSLYVVYLQDGTAKEEFDNEFFADAAVSIEGQGIEYSEGSIRLTGDVKEGKVTLTSGYKTLEVVISNYTAPIAPIEHAFHGIGDTASMSNILETAGIVSFYNNIAVSDETLLTIEGDTLTTLAFFNEAALTVTLEDGAEVIVKLTNPEFIAAGQPVVIDSVGSFRADVELQPGAQLSVSAAQEDPLVAEAVQAALGEDVAVIYYDIKIVDAKEAKIETGATVTLNLGIGLPDVPEGKIAKVTGKVFHATDDGVELLDSQFNLAEGQIKSVTFTTDSFSLFGIAYTIDFISAEVNKAWSWPGEGSYRIADILAEIGVTGDVESVELVRTVDVGGSEKALYLEEREDGHYLVSEEAFADTFVLTAVVDGVRYHFTVTDAAFYTDLSRFLKEVNITNAISTTSDEWTVYENKQYTIDLLFQEDYERKQFSNDDPLTYQIPSEIDVLPAEGDITISLTTSDQTYEIRGNHYTITEDGLLTFTWNSSDPNFDRLKNTGNVELRFHIVGSIVEGTNLIEFGNGITKGITLEEPENTVHVSKQAERQSGGNHNGDIKYTVNVTAVGDQTNVKVTDAITVTDTGDRILSLDTASGFTVTSNKRQNVEFTKVSESADGFEYVFPTMEDGEVISIVYYADVDYNKINTLYGGDATVEATQNGVHVYANDDPKDEATTNLAHISYSSFSKTGTASDTENPDRTKTVTWTIRANQERVLPLTYISDTIDVANRSNTKYSGNGLHLKYQLPNGQLYEDDIPWNDPSIKRTGDPAYRWVFNPADYHPTTSVQGLTEFLNVDDLPYAYYEITYTTDVDVTHMLEDINVKNDAHSDYGHGTQTVVVGPDEDNKFSVQKSVIKNDLANKQVEWSISIHVPPQGFESLIVEDVYPNLPERNYQDTLDPFYNIDVTDLVGNECYTLNTDDPAKMSIIFYKDNANTPGLTSTENGRTIHVHFRTNTDPKWIEDYASNPWVEHHHVNNAIVTANGTPKDTSAIAYLGSPRFNKSLYTQSMITIDDEEYIIYLYRILLSQVNTDDITITDTFDTTLLSYYDPTDGVPANWWTDMAGTIIGGLGNNTWRPEDGIGLLEMTPTATGITLHTDWIPKEGDGYWPEYLVSYSLIAKVSDLEARAAQNGGSYSISNHASNGSLNSETTVDYSYDRVDKEILHAVDKPGEYAEYRITLNPLKATLNGGNVMALTDQLTNLSLDYQSIHIVTDPAGRENDITYDMSGDTVTYQIPDATKVTITYRARVIAKGEYKNKATLRGQDQEVTWNASQDITAEGSGVEYSFYVLKYADGDMSATSRLPGAEFTLYGPKGDSEAAEPTLPAGVPVGYVTRGTFTTGSDGMAHVEGTNEHPIEPNKDYYLIETGVPAGYQADTTQSGDKVDKVAYKVNISSANTPDYTNYIYFNGDTVKVRNKPIASTLKILKSITGDTAYMTEEQLNQLKASISFKIAGTFEYTDGSGTSQAVYHTVTVPYADFTGGAYTLSTTTITIDGTNYEARVIGGRSYTVTEVLSNEVTGYTRTTTYSVNGGAQSAGSSAASVSATVPVVVESGKTLGEGRVNFVNNYSETSVDVEVEKVWAGDENDTSDRQAVTVHLLKNGVQMDFAYDKILTESNSWKASWTDLEPADYTVAEEPVPGYSGEVTVDNSVRPIQIKVTNTDTRKSITVNKEWLNTNRTPTTWPSGVTVEMKLLCNGTQYATSAQLSSSNQSHTWMIPDYDESNTYTVVEDKIEGYAQDAIVYKDAQGYAYYHDDWYGVTYSVDPSYPKDSSNYWLWNNTFEYYPSAQPDGSVVVTNKENPPDDTKTKLTVQKKWYDSDGATELTAAEIAGLQATVQLVRYRTEKAVAKLHLINNDNSNEIGSFIIPKSENLTLIIEYAGYHQGQRYCQVLCANLSAFPGAEAG